MCLSRYEDHYVQAGITAWGKGCGRQGVPGAYADISSSLCFIHWDTKCQAGSKYSDFYDIPICDNWIDNEISELEKQLKQAKQAERNPATTPKERQLYRKLATETQGYIVNAKSLKSKCDIDPRNTELGVRSGSNQ